MNRWGLQLFCDDNLVVGNNLHFSFLSCPLVLIFHLICISFDRFNFFLFHYMFFLKAASNPLSAPPRMSLWSRVLWGMTKYQEQNGRHASPVPPLLGCHQELCNPILSSEKRTQQGCNAPPSHRRLDRCPTTLV